MKSWTSFLPNLKPAAVKALKSLALFLIATYRACFSGWVGGICRFQPTCSCYARDAFTAHPPLTAFILTLKRLLKCHPFGPYGFDPVPPVSLSSGDKN